MVITANRFPVPVKSLKRELQKIIADLDEKGMDAFLEELRLENVKLLSEPVVECINIFDDETASLAPLPGDIVITCAESSYMGYACNATVLGHSPRQAIIMSGCYAILQSGNQEAIATISMLVWQFRKEMREKRRSGRRNENAAE